MILEGLAELVTMFREMSWAGMLALVTSVAIGATSAVIGIVQVMQIWADRKTKKDAPEDGTQKEIDLIQKELAGLQAKFAGLQEALEGTVEVQIKDVKEDIDRLQDRMEKLTDSVIAYLSRKTKT